MTSQTEIRPSPAIARRYAIVKPMRARIRPRGTMGARRGRRGTRRMSPTAAAAAAARTAAWARPNRTKGGPSVTNAPPRPRTRAAGLESSQPPLLKSMDSRASSDPRVVIVGGGFAGLTAARTLRRAPVQITLVDRHNHHVFQPLLYQVATAGLSSTNIAAPLRHILRRQRNATVLLADATGVDLRRQRLILRDGELPYDFLVLAAGATHSYFGHEEWSRHAPGLKTLNDAIDIRRRVLLAFEEAERETDEARRAEWLTFVVIGAGPTGVEMAGTLAEIARHTLRGGVRRIDPAPARIILVEGTDRVLPPYPADLSEKAQRQLEALGVVVFTKKMETGVDATGVWLGEESVAAR